MNDLNILTQDGAAAFPDIIWSRPERASQAGRLLVIGGNESSLKQPMEAFAVAEQSGAGTIIVALPESLKKQLGALDILFCPSNASGSFGKDSLRLLLNTAAAADCVLLAGDLSNNSETTQLLEEFLLKVDKPVVVSGDAINSILATTPELLDKTDTTVILNPSQLQKLAKTVKSPIAYTAKIDLAAFVELLGGLVQKANLVSLHNNEIWVYAQGSISRTKRADLKDDYVWQASTAARAAVNWMQNLDKPFEALSTAALSSDQHQQD